MAAARAARSRHPVVAAAGGDGTVNAVAAAVLETGKTLGVLPLGTLNHFSKDVGVPADLEAALRVLAGGNVLEVDVARVNGRVFLNNSSLGAYPTIVRYREQLQRRHGIGKWPAFVWACLSLLRHSLTLSLRLTTDGAMERIRTPLLFVGNNEYQLSGAALGTRTSLTTGQLGVCVIRARRRLWMVWLLLRAVFGRLAEADDFVSIQTKRLVVETRHPLLQVATDGEVIRLTTPLQYEILPRALRVLVSGPEPAKDLESPNLETQSLALTPDQPGATQLTVGG